MAMPIIVISDYQYILYCWCLGLTLETLGGSTWEWEGEKAMTMMVCLKLLRSDDEPGGR